MLLTFSRVLRISLLLLSSQVLIACGGGGEAPLPEPKPKVLVNAGSDISLNEQTAGVLNGDASGAAGAIVFAWTSQPTLEITHADTALADATFLAPIVTQTTQYTLTLTATDTNGTIGQDTRVITVEPVNILPVANITASTIDGYAQHKYPVGQKIDLDASSSFDEDPQSEAASITAYEWQQIAGPQVVFGVAADQVITDPTFSFMSPILNVDQDIVLRIVVTDQEGATAHQDITLTILDQSQTLPSTSLSRSMEVFAGETISLRGEGVSTAPNAYPFSISWTNQSAISVPVINRDTVNAHAIAPNVDVTTELEFEFIAVDSFGNDASDTMLVTVHPQTITQLNDTGVVSYASNNSIENGYQGEFAGQDAESGYDRTVLSGVGDKAGRGANGFDFTKLDSDGNEADSEVDFAPCVRDNITGLIWEVKTDNSPSDLHDVDNRFSWYLVDDNGDFAGYFNSGSSVCNLGSGNCNISTYLQAVNSQGLCGFYDWRLPDHDELQSIVHFGKSVPPLLDTDYFVFVGAEIDEPSWYWTMQASSDGVTEAGAQNAWAIDFHSGVDSFLNKGQVQRVRLVRAGR